MLACAWRLQFSVGFTNLHYKFGACNKMSANQGIRFYEPLGASKKKCKEIWVSVDR